MYEFLKSAFSALPSVGASPLALIGYIALVASWLLIALKVRRNKNLLQHLHHLPETDRLAALKLEMGSVQIKGGLSPEQWLRARTHQFYFLGFGILCLVIIILFAISAVTKESAVNHTSIPIDAKLELADTSITEQPDDFPLLDIKLRNVGDKIAFLKKAVFHVTDVYNLEDPFFYVETHIDPSWNYNIELPLNNHPYTKEVELSQAIGANDIDRFTFSLGHGLKPDNRSIWRNEKGNEESPSGEEPLLNDSSERKGKDRTASRRKQDKSSQNKSEDQKKLDSIILNAPEGDYAASVMRIYVELIYNEKDERVTTQPMIFEMRTPPHFIAAVATPKSNAQQIATENRRKLEEVNKLEGKKTQKVLEMLEQLKKASN